MRKRNRNRTAKRQLNRRGRGIKTGVRSLRELEAEGFTLFDGKIGKYRLVTGKDGAILPVTEWFR